MSILRRSVCCLSVQSVRVFLPPSVCLSVCLLVCLSVCLFACLSVCSPVCLSVCKYVCCLSVQSACQSVCLSACMPACLVCLLSPYPSVRLSVSPSVSPNRYLSTCLHVATRLEQVPDRFRVALLLHHVNVHRPQICSLGIVAQNAFKYCLSSLRLTVSELHDCKFLYRFNIWWIKPVS